MTTATKPRNKRTAAAKPTPTPPVAVTKPTDLWSGEFGNAYTERNRVDWQARIPFWQSAIEFCTPGTVFEFGCNAGWNLRAIQACAPNLELFGVDVNAKAAEEARQAGFEVQVVGEQGVAGLYEPGSMDLVFTAGVLIHIPPADLERTMRSLVALTGRFMIAVEYDADREEEVEYRGHKGALWKRPYGALYAALGLRLLSFGEAWPGEGVTYYLLEKPV